MKKIIIGLLVLTMLIVAVLPVSVADDVTLKTYDEAVNGELLYTFNFNGDNVFTPKEIVKECSNYTFTPSEDGKSITIKSNEGTAKVAAFYGGMVKQYKGDKKTVYSIVFKQKANTPGTEDMLNRVGVGGLFSDNVGVNLFHAYTNYTVCNKNIGPCLHQGKTKIEDYKSWADIGEIDEIDGFQTLMVEYNAPDDTVTCYTLKKGGDIKNEADWLKVHQAPLKVNAIADGIGCGIYLQYTGVDVEIKDVELYKGTPYAVEEEPSTETTAEEESSTETTAEPAPESDKPAESTNNPQTPDETAGNNANETEGDNTASGGCGGTVTVAGMALVASLASCAVVVSKKKRR